MSKITSYTFLEQIYKKDTNLLNYYLYTGKYENCPKNNNLRDIDKMLKEENTYSNQSLLDCKKIYLIKK